MGVGYAGSCQEGSWTELSLGSDPHSTPRGRLLIEPSKLLMRPLEHTAYELCIRDIAVFSLPTPAWGTRHYVLRTTY